MPTYAGREGSKTEDVMEVIEEIKDMRDDGISAELVDAVPSSPGLSDVTDEISSPPTDTSVEIMGRVGATEGRMALKRKGSSEPPADHSKKREGRMLECCQTMGVWPKLTKKVNEAGLQLQAGS